MTILGHFQRVEIDSVWLGPNYPPTILDWATIDAITSQMVNGDCGGCWAPLTPIVIGGSGLTLTGPLYVLGAGTLTSTVAGAFQCNEGNIPQLGPTHSGRNRTIVSPCNAGRSCVPYGAIPFLYGLQSTAQAFLNLDANGNVASTTPNQLYVPLRVHNGSRLTSATVSFAVTIAHAPAQTPAFRVVRVDVSGNVTPLTSSAAAGLTPGIVGFSGYMFATQPASSSSWYNAGEAQSFTIPCDQNNLVDVTQYTYWLQILDEQGSSGYPYQLPVAPPVEVASNIHYGVPNSAVALINSGGNVELTFSSGTFHTGEVVTITGTGTAADGTWPITVTGSTMVLNDSAYSAGTPAANALITAGQTTFLRGVAGYLDNISTTTAAPVLVKDQVNESANGIWLVQAGAWTRSLVPLTQGLIVPVAQGSVNGGTYWQLLNNPGPPSQQFSNPANATWAFGVLVVLGQQVSPFNENNGGLIFTCTTAGTTGTTVPQWPAQIGATVTDNTVVWSLLASSTPPVIFAGGPTSGSSTLVPVVGAFDGQFCAQSTLFLNVAVSFSGISSVAFQ